MWDDLTLQVRLLQNMMDERRVEDGRETGSAEVGDSDLPVDHLIRFSEDFIPHVS